MKKLWNHLTLCFSSRRAKMQISPREDHTGSIECVFEWIDSLHWSLAIVFFWIIGILRTSIVFALGWSASAGTERFKRLQRAMDSPIYRRAQAFINQWGALAVPLCFLTVGFQTAVILTTGFTRMPLIRWIPAMLLGTLLWGIIYGTIGMAVFWAWLERPFMALALIAVVVLVIIVVRRRQK